MGTDQGERVEAKYRLPRDLHDWITREAERREVGRNYLLTIAVRRYRETCEPTSGMGATP
jgi:hypothetical protein